MISDLATTSRALASIAVPEDRVLAMIATANLALTEVDTIEDSKKVCDMAEAIAAITKKIELSKETQRLAMKLLVEAEQRLGKITSEMPHAKTCGETKRHRLEDHYGINHRRANVAERLAKIPEKKINAVIAKGARTMNGVVTGLGIISNGTDLRKDNLRNLLYLTAECIETLERALKGTPPPAGNVKEFRRRYEKFKVY